LGMVPSGTPEFIDLSATNEDRVATKSTSKDSQP
jgi:hypothetical protein